MRSLVTSLHCPKYFDANGMPKDLVSYQVYRVIVFRGWLSFPIILECSEMPVFENLKIRYTDLNGKPFVFTRQQNDKVKVRKSYVLKDASFIKESSHE